MAARVARLMRAAQFQRTAIATLEGRHIARVHDDGQVFLCETPNGDIVMRSGTGRNVHHIEHFDFMGRYCGRSFLGSDHINSHFDSRDNYIGHDTLNMVSNVVIHFDEKRREIGRSSMKSQQDGAVLVADRALEQTVELFAKHEVFSREDLKSAYNEAQRQRQLCLAGEVQACEKSRFAVIDFLQMIEKH